MVLIIFFFSNSCFSFGKCVVFLFCFSIINFICSIISYMQVYHPNIDLEGNVCLNILREDWKPVLNINTVIYGLYHLFTVWLFFWIFPLSNFDNNIFFYLVCRNQITRIHWITMPLLCWERTQRCLNLTWGGQWLEGMSGKPFSHAVFRPFARYLQVPVQICYQCVKALGL